MLEDEVRSMLRVAGIKYRSLYQLENRYWPKAYVNERANSPWWLIVLDQGEIVIGWRKRVISINWSATPFRKIVTEDNVTKGEDHVHAYSMFKATEYLVSLKACMKEMEINNEE